MGKKGNKLILDSIPLPKRFLVNQIRIAALGEGIHDGNSSEIYSHDKMIVVGFQGSIIKSTVQCAEVK